MTLKPEQLQALEQIKAFIKDPQQRVFVLKGYAGTGKTTLVGHVVQWLEGSNIKPVLLATTGRAAKVMQNKTGFRSSTVHSCIYTFDSITGKDEAGGDPWNSQTGQLFLDFGIKPTLDQTDNLVFIVDEASMITHEVPEEVHMAKFGTGSLLDDFMQYAGRNKIIFVGDPCQLPPVSHNPFSAALDEHFLARRYSLGAQSVELKEIVRQHDRNEILPAAGKFREDLLRNAFVKYPKIKVPRGINFYLARDEKQLIEDYVMILRGSLAPESIMICHANWQCARLNNAVRSIMQKGPTLEPGELLLIVQNSYDVDLANGDQVIVEKVSFDEQRAGLNFYNVTVFALHNGQKHDTKLIGDLLYNEAPGITPQQMKPLFIDFDKRMKLHGVKRNSDVYRDAMLKDPYLNALRAKFGYVVTCHKAQGGEWTNVFLNIYKSLYGMKSPNLYRWYYTAMTRAREYLYVNDGWWVEGYDQRKPRL